MLAKQIIALLWCLVAGGRTSLADTGSAEKIFQELIPQRKSIRR